LARAGLSTSAVVDAALAVVDAHGLDGLTLAAVAGRTGVAAPSLYKHIESLAELRALVRVRVMDELTEQLTAVVLGRSGADAVAALMHACRAYAGEHPDRYAAMPMDPLHDPDLAEAGERLMAVFLAVLRGYGLHGSTAVHATRCLRAIVHGFVSIEAAGGFGLPENLDETYEHLIAMFTRSLPHP
jgi:AcrR family transcriptional regulator